jgi:hypothetical protein
MYIDVQKIKCTFLWVNCFVHESKVMRDKVVVVGTRISNTLYVTRLISLQNVA